MIAPVGEAFMRSGNSTRFFATCRCCGSGAAARPSLDSAARGPILSRRNFTAGGIAAFGFGAAAASMPAKLFAQAKPSRIDIHHHVTPPAWLEATSKAGLGNPLMANWTIQRSLDDMEKGAVATAIASAAPPGIGFLKPAEAAAAARASNEFIKKLTQDHPGRFGMFALLPMPHVDETLKEIAYALDTLNADGVAFSTSYGEKYLGDAAFAPVMDELHRRKATVYTHPVNPACCSNNLANFPPIYIEWGTDTTRTIASLIFSGTAARCPDIKFIFSHAGGTVTALTDRLTVQMVTDPRYKAFTSEGVTAELKRFYYDTAQAANPVAMAALVKMATTSQIVFGTDFPFRTSADHVKGLAEVFGAEDLRRIDRDNALKLVPRWRA
jgi:predicted TIM-barrel fold metal-dependent hydrolase